MDNSKITDKYLLQLNHFLTREMHVDFPLYQNNLNSSIRICFETLDIYAAKEIAREIIEKIFGESQFWMCEYGSISGETFKKNGMLRSSSDILVIPYHSELVDPEWFEYPYDAISCVHTCFNEVDVNAYIDYCFRLDFLSNSIYVVSLAKKCVVAIYDRRCIDIAAVDPTMLQEFRKKYAELLY